MYRARRFAHERETTVAFLAPLICLSLLCVYHHHYDAIALLGPIIVYFGRPSGPRDRPLILLIAALIIMYVGFWPVDKSQKLVEVLLGEGNASGLKLVGNGQCSLCRFAYFVAPIH